MNYRHAYHAGNFADVVKHAVLCRVLAHLKAKETPVFLLDSHAGIGRYDLAAEAALKTGEAADGIVRVLAAPDHPGELAEYLDAVKALNGVPAGAVGGQAIGGLRWYPGSPRLLRMLMRPGDRLAACEMHPQDGAALAREFAGDRQVKVHVMDGYTALKAFLPPPERRGLVVVDPPFEARDEFAQLVKAIQAAHRRWATGVYALWYPIKGRRPVDVFHEDLAGTGIRKILATELMVFSGDDPERLNGSGLILINPPWRLCDELKTMLPYLARLLAQEPGLERWRLDWLVGE